MRIIWEYLIHEFQIRKSEEHTGWNVNQNNKGEDDSQKKNRIMEMLNRKLRYKIGKRKSPSIEEQRTI